MATPSNQRFKDVLLALAAVGPHNIGLGRLHLQKFIYLTDVFSAVWRVISKPAEFRPDQRGPYDRQIQHAADALVFRGLVGVRKLAFRAQDIRADYYLGPAGARAVEILKANPVLREESELCDEIASEVVRRGITQIRSIVYAEPTYLGAIERGDSSRLRTNRPSANQTLRLAQLFRVSWEATSQQKLTPAMFVQVMFLVFDAQRQSVKTDPDEANE